MQRGGVRWGDQTRAGRGTTAWNQGFPKQGYQPEITGNCALHFRPDSSDKVLVTYSRVKKRLPRGSWQPVDGSRIKMRQEM